MIHNMSKFVTVVSCCTAAEMSGMQSGKHAPPSPVNIDAVGLQCLLIFDAMTAQLGTQTLAHQLTHIVCIQLRGSLLLCTNNQC